MKKQKLKTEDAINMTGAETRAAVSGIWKGRPKEPLRKSYATELTRLRALPEPGKKRGPLLP